VLRTNLSDWTSEDLWRTYIQLSEAEAAFRIHKSELSLRPIWHQREDRVLAHILVCFLAYVLWKTLEQWQSRAGLGNSPRTIFEELAAIQSTDVVVLPTATLPERELRLRCVVRPDRAQAALLQRLGLRLPERLRMPTGARKCSAKLAPQVLENTHAHPRNCGSWASPRRGEAPSLPVRPRIGSTQGAAPAPFAAEQSRLPTRA
jgi:hypothetical protein